MVGDRLSFMQLASMKLRSVRVAILDTGVDACHPVLRGRCAAAGDGDVVGHGTSVAGIVARLAPNAVIVSRRVLAEDCTGDGDDVMAALEAVVESDADIVNLSLTVDSRRHAERFGRLLARAERGGKLIVAAADNVPVNGDVGFPASHPSVLGVGAGGDCATWGIATPPNGPIGLVARSEHLLTAHIGGGYCRAEGTSFAAPIVSAACALLMGAGFRGGISEWRRQLAACSVRSSGGVDPLAIAPEADEQGEATVTYVCPCCGAVRRVNDAFGWVCCRRCHCLGRRDVLLDPGELIGVMAYVREARRFVAGLPREDEVRADLRAAFRRLDRHPEWPADRRRAELHSALHRRIVGMPLTSPSRI